MAAELISIMLEFFPLEECPPLNTKSTVLMLLASMVDSWDKLRQKVFIIFCHYNASIEGIKSFQEVAHRAQHSASILYISYQVAHMEKTACQVCHAVRWARALIDSPRAKEADGGALIFRVLLRHLVLEQGWMISVTDDDVRVVQPGSSDSHSLETRTSAFLQGRFLSCAHGYIYIYIPSALAICTL